MTAVAAAKAVTLDHPPRQALVLTTLTVGAIVANINLGIANVALPDIGRDLNATQVQQTMVASMFTMGLAASVLYLGAIGDRYGRKILLLLGSALSIPAALLAGFAPSVQALIGARLLGGLAAGLLFPTTLSLISGLWRGSAQTKAIALWSGIGGGAAALGGLVGGALLEQFWWGSVFLFTVPFALLVFVVALFVIPWRAGEAREGTVDHLGGVLSVIAVAALVLGIQQLPEGWDTQMTVLFSVALIGFVLFFFRQRHARKPLVDLKAASVPSFWVAALAGTIAFGSLIGGFFLGQQFTQNILHYETFEAAAVTLPSSVMLIAMAPVAARWMLRSGGKGVIAAGLIILALGFISMEILWRENASIWVVLLSYTLLGTGVGLAATAATRSLMASLTVSRAGMGSAFADLMRDFGGAVMQSLMGTVLAVTYSSYLYKVYDALPEAKRSALSEATAQKIVSSYQAASDVAKQFPQVDATKIIDAASAAFTDGKGAAFGLGTVMTLLALALVLIKYPGQQKEGATFQRIAAESARELAHEDAVAGK